MKYFTWCGIYRNILSYAVFFCTYRTLFSYFLSKQRIGLACMALNIDLFHRIAQQEVQEPLVRPCEPLERDALQVFQPLISENHGGLSYLLDECGCRTHVQQRLLN